MSPSEDGCFTLRDKYEIDLTESLTTTFHLSGVASYSEAEAAAEQLVGRSGSYSVTQNFLYVDSEGKLPLFPLAHQESFTLKGGLHDFQDALRVSYDADSKKIYSIPAVKDLPKKSVLTLIERLTTQIKALFGARRYQAWHPMPSLLVHLKSSDSTVNRALFDSILHTFKEAEKTFPDPFFFDFKVGGSGGTEFALKLNALSQKLPNLSSEEKIQIATRYPALLLVGYTEESRFTLSRAELAGVVENIRLQVTQKLLPNYRVSQSTIDQLIEKLQAAR